ncbi:4Fe-4S binding protein [bacterium]|nr:4Fe-4S binding protein [bacterium]
MSKINLKRRSAIIIATGCLLCAGTALGALRAAQNRGKAKINSFKCTGCGRCIDMCPNGAITKTAGMVRVNTSKCTGCGMCQMDCPHNAITMG